MSVDGNFVVLIHKQLLCLVLRRGLLGVGSRRRLQRGRDATPMGGSSLLTVGGRRGKGERSEGRR